jgi:two-component system phosphate regulon response regulator PhoB
VSEVRKRVLVIDDEPDIYQLVRVLLARLPVDVVYAARAAEAAQVIRSSTIDLILLDLMLPDVSGVQFLKQMRAREQYQSIQVLVLSALVDPDQIREALEAGANRYLTKPYMANNLVSVVQEMLQIGRRVQSNP